MTARLERGLSVFEERIQKFVDTSENESRQKCEIFDAFSNKEIESIITPRNRHGFCPASKVSCGEGHRCSVQSVENLRVHLGRSEGLQTAGTRTQGVRRGATLC